MIKRKVINLEIRIRQYFNYIWGKIILCFYFRKNRVDLLQFSPDGFQRLPKKFAQKVSKEVYINSKFPAGKKICFKTDAENLKLIILLKKRCNFWHMSNAATSGIDIYCQDHKNYIWKKCVAPKTNTQMLIAEEVHLYEKEKEVFLYLPPFAEIAAIVLNNKENNNFGIVNENEHKITIACYGSSITQGCGASHPSLSYVNYLSRKLRCNIYNYGFSEAARGESSLIKYLVLNTKPDIIVAEYDHNVSVEKLEQTHCEIYRTIRQFSNCLIIFISRISGGISISCDEEEKRIKIIQNTVNYAYQKDDHDVLMIEGRELIKEEKDLYLIDDRHPNDRGMSIIGDSIIKEIGKRGFQV